MPDRIGQQLGNYRLLKELGRGAFAEVYLAEHLYLERLAAIKVLHVQMDPETQEHFLREARTVAHLQHPHILQVLDFGIDKQTPYLVMQHTPGGTLREHHPKGTRLPAEQIVTYVKQIASALDYAHQQHVIHRDIKPHNLLLTATHEVVLGDFGLAVMQRSLDALSLSNPNAGTPLYMAPEQIQYRPCPASDQYALGVMVYEWLVGEAPFNGASLIEVFSHHLYQAPPSLRERLPDLPAAVEAVVLRALAKDPEQRFACVTDFASALEDACEITQRLTMPGPAKQRTQEPMVPQSTLFVPPTLARAAEASSASTQPAPMTVQGAERGSVALLVADRPTPSKPSKPSLAQNNRQRFLRRVRAIWIEGMLNHSLQGAALIALGLQEQVDALANPWHLVLHHPDTAPRAFPVGTRITEVYDAANEELLILGAPGSGKTTLLLELARDLLDRAEQDEQQLMPVIFPLSSWASKQQTLTEWMIEELISKYQVPRQLARSWVETDQILPLLDGLDEVVTEKRTTCIETLNSYHQEHPFLPLVVSSRSADYIQQAGRLKLTTAVTIQSLSQQQVDDYLARGGEALWALRVALHQDESLRELAETPLMLSILTLTYHDMPVEDLLQGGIAPTRQQIFDRYVDRMLMQRGTEMRYTSEQTTHWLRILAGQMKRQSQTTFYLEQMQSIWLPTEWTQQVYSWLGVRIAAILIGCLVGLGVLMVLSEGFVYPLTNLLLGGVVGGLLSSTLAAFSTVKSFRTHRPLLLLLVRAGFLGLGVGLGMVLLMSSPYHSVLVRTLTGIYFGLGIVLLTMLLARWPPVSHQTSNLVRSDIETKRSFWRQVLSNDAIRQGLLVGGLFGLSYGLNTGTGLDLSYGLSDGLFYGLNWGLCGVSISLLLGYIPRIIVPTEILMWSWKRLWHGLKQGEHTRQTLLLALVIALSTGLSKGLSWVSVGELSKGLSDGLGAALGWGMSTAGSYWLLFGLFQGVSSTSLREQQRMIPNQGIHRSGRNGLILGLLACSIAVLIGGGGFVMSNGLFSTLSFWPSDWLTNPNIGLSVRLDYGYVDFCLFGCATSRISDVLNVGWQIGLAVGLLVTLFMGGLAWWRHYVLRFLLWRNKSIPLNYPRFLDYAAEHILLRKVGGGYIFVHRLLLEYFASLDTTAPSDATSVKK